MISLVRILGYTLSEDNQNLTESAAFLRRQHRKYPRPSGGFVPRPSLERCPSF